jgi:hypothetical protein
MYKQELMLNKILQIDELEKMVPSAEIRGLKTKAVACIYYPERSCSAPKIKLKICQTCPRCVPSRALFNYIRMFAIFLMRMMGGQSSK